MGARRHKQRIQEIIVPVERFVSGDELDPNRVLPCLAGRRRKDQVSVQENELCRLPVYANCAHMIAGLLEVDDIACGARKVNRITSEPRIASAFVSGIRNDSSYRRAEMVPARSFAKPSEMPGPGDIAAAEAAVANKAAHRNMVC